VAASARRKRPLRVFLVALLVIVLYFLFFPYPLQREMVARPAWAVSLDATAPAAGDTAGAAPFRLGDTFGYVRPDGTLLSKEKTLFAVSLSAAGYVNYTRLGTDWIMYDPAGRRLFSFSGRGYPLLSADGGRLFNVKSDLSGLIEMDKTGEPLWERDFPTMMSSISLQGDSVLVGLLNGTFQLLNRHGSPVFELAPGGSRLPVIAGCALSPDGTLLASVSGVDPQYLAVFQGAGSSFTALAKRRLPADLRREVRMSFSPDSRFLVFEGVGSAGLFDPASARLAWLDLRGPLAGLAFPGKGRLAALAAQGGALAAVSIVAPFTAPIARESFPAQDLFMGAVEGQLLLGVNGKLLRIDVEAM
jgi:hypothetical protein